MNNKCFFLLIVILLSLTGCAVSAYEPIKIEQNIESCDVCKMGIGEIESAAQMILKDGKPILFDDIGCLVVYIQEEKPEYKVAFVHDYHSEKWISFDQATFVHTQSIDSPMNYRLVAFESEEEAESFQKVNDGTIFSSSALVSADINGFKSNDQEHSH